MSYHHREIIRGREVFSLRLFHNGFCNQLITHLPDKLIEYSDHNFFYRIQDKDLSQINHKESLQLLANKIKREKESPLFYYPDYLLTDGLLSEHTFKRILELTSHFEIKDYIFSFDSYSVEYYTLYYSWHNWRIYNRRIFRHICNEITLREFEMQLSERVKFIYVECWSKDNRSFLVNHEDQKILVLTDSKLHPLIFIFK